MEEKNLFEMSDEEKLEYMDSLLRDGEKLKVFEKIISLSAKIEGLKKFGSEKNMALVATMGHIFTDEEKVQLLPIFANNECKIQIIKSIANEQIRMQLLSELKEQESKQKRSEEKTIGQEEKSEVSKWPINRIIEMQEKIEQYLSEMKHWVEEVRMQEEILSRISENTEIKFHGSRYVRKEANNLTKRRIYTEEELRKMESGDLMVIYIKIWELHNLLRNRVMDLRQEKEINDLRIKYRIAEVLPVQPLVSLYDEYTRMDGKSQRDTTTIGRKNYHTNEDDVR